MYTLPKDSRIARWRNTFALRYSVGMSSRANVRRMEQELPYWINAGIYALSRSIRDHLPQRGDHETSTFPRLAESGQLGAYKSQAYWRGVDTIKDVNEVASEMQRRLLSLFREV